MKDAPVPTLSRSECICALSPSMLYFYFIYILATLLSYNLHPIKSCALLKILKHPPYPMKLSLHRVTFTAEQSFFFFLNGCALLLEIVNYKCFVYGIYNLRFSFTCQFKFSSLGFQILFLRDK